MSNIILINLSEHHLRKTGIVLICGMYCSKTAVKKATVKWLSIIYLWLNRVTFDSQTMIWYYSI